MKLYFKKLGAGLLLAGGLVSQAFADGTEAGTNVINRATLTFDSGSETGQVLESSPSGNTTLDVGNGQDTTFVVDRKLDIEVASTDTTEVSVNDGAEGYLTFTITNNGNADQEALLTIVADPSSGDPHGGTDNADMSGLQICISGGTGTSDGGGLTNVTCSAVGTLTLNTESLIHDGANSITAYIVGTADALDAGDRAVYALVAQPAETDGTLITTDDRGTANVATTVEDVFADGAGDVTVANASFNDGAIAANAADTVENGQHSDSGTFVILVTELELAKTSEVVWDPFSCSVTTAPTDSTDDVATSCGTGNPKAIPGAYVRYTLTITNNGNLATTGASISDTVDTDTLIVTASVTAEDGDGAALTTAPDSSTTTTTVLNVTGINVAAKDDASGDDVVVITFFVEVQ